MLKIVLSLSIILFLSSCDVPRNRSSIYDSGYSERTNFNNSASAGSFYNDDGGSTTNNDNNNDNNDDNNQDDTTNSSIPSAYQHCINGQNQFPTSSQYLGNYFICQSQTDKTKVYFWPQNSISSKICMIPMYSNGSQSINIGDAQCQYTLGTTGVEFTLYKNRSGFENYVINAVMIMKDESFVYPYPYTLKYTSPIANTTAFFMCMNTAYQTPAYCQAFAQMKQYQLHLFN